MADSIISALKTKFCRRCGKTLPITGFYKDRKMPDGLYKHCRNCERKRFSDYYARPEFRERVKASAKRWSKANADKLPAIKKRCRDKNAERHKETRQAWKKNNRDLINQRARDRYWATIDISRTKAHLQRERNRERRRELNRVQYRKHIEKRRIEARQAAAIRRIRTAVSSADVTDLLWVAKCEYWGWRCYLCGASLTLSSATTDHRIPIARGGLHVLSNLAPACRHCNCSKRARTETEYRLWRKLPKISMTGISRSPLPASGCL